MKEIGQVYQSLLGAHISSKRPEVPFYSSVTGAVISSSGKLDSDYWRQNLESPVLFNTAVDLMLLETPSEALFLEVGPHSALSGPLRQIFKAASLKQDPIYVSSLERNRNSKLSILTTAGKLWQYGVQINMDAITSTGKFLTDLPPYPWNHNEQYWSESRVMRSWRLREHPHHELLGTRFLEASESEPAWRNLLSLQNVSWLHDHKIINDIVLPCAAYIAMAGEAIRQISGSDAYFLRNLIVKSALVLQEEETVEIITTMKPYRLTNSLDSKWYDFAISSFNGTTWNQHCIGQVSAGSSNDLEKSHVEESARKVAAPSLYVAMRKMGLNYGPNFQKMTEITACPVSPRASSVITNDRSQETSHFSLHPTTIDNVLQLFMVAVSQGLPRRLGGLLVPSGISSVFICPGGQQTEQLLVEATAETSGKSVKAGRAIATVSDNVVLSFQGCTFSPLDNEAMPEAFDTVSAVRLQWKPDIHFLPPKDLMRPKPSKRNSAMLVEKLAMLCILETAHQISSYSIEQEHMKLFAIWLKKQQVEVQKGKYTIIDEAHDWELMGSSARLALIREVGESVDSTEGASVGRTIQRIFDNTRLLLEGAIDSVEILIQDEGLTNLYSFYQEMWDCEKLFELLGHSKPTLRILEVGAGTGGTTGGVLRTLHSDQGERLYSQYCFTDISPGFFPAAKERFKEFSALEFRTLDISKDPTTQGFEPESFDLIIASNVSWALLVLRKLQSKTHQVLHATPSLGETLGNVRKLLSPGGRLFLQELCPGMYIRIDRKIISANQ